MTVYKPDANFVFCRLPDHAMNGPEVTRSLFIEDNIYIKDCAGKSLEQGNRYLRIAARSRAENDQLVEALKRIIASCASATIRGMKSTAGHRTTVLRLPLSRSN
jgi:threonine-phosphate decarboxylase